MEFRDYACPNCGANIDIANSKAAYCEFCGTNIVDVKKSTEIEKYHEQAMIQFKFKRFKDCFASIYIARRLGYEHCDFVLMEAMIKKEPDRLRGIDKTKLSEEVLTLGKEALQGMDVSIRYVLKSKDKKKLKLWNVDRCPVQKIDILETDDAKMNLSFAKIILSHKQYEMYKRTIVQNNDLNYSKFMEKYNKWKKNFKTKQYTALFLFFLAIFLLFFNDYYLLLVLIFGLIATSFALWVNSRIY